MSTINNGDKFLVNRSNNSYQLEAKDTMAELQDTDLMLVNRGGTSYKVTGSDVKASINPTFAPVIASVALVQTKVVNSRFNNQDFQATSILDGQVNPYPTWSIKVRFTAKLSDGSTTTMYGVLNGNLKVTDLQTADPGYTNAVGNVSLIEFPAVLPDGRRPDEVLLEGSSITVISKATNTVGTDTKDSNTITPAASCVPGAYITDAISSIDDIDPTNSVVPGPEQSGNRQSVNVTAAAVAPNGDWIFGCINTQFWYCDDKTNQPPQVGQGWHQASVQSWSYQGYRYYPAAKTFANNGSGVWVAGLIPVGGGNTIENTSTPQSGSTYPVLAYSTDNGRSWSLYGVGDGGVFSNFASVPAVYYADGKFVAVGRQYSSSGGGMSKAAYSSDGVNWTLTNMGSTGPNAMPASVEDCADYTYWNQEWRSLIYKNGVWFATSTFMPGSAYLAGIEGRRPLNLVMTSTDAITWNGIGKKVGTSYSSGYGYSEGPGTLLHDGKKFVGWHSARLDNTSRSDNRENFLKTYTTYYSFDGFDWFTVRSNSAFGVPYCAGYGLGVYILGISFRYSNYLNYPTNGDSPGYYTTSDLFNYKLTYGPNRSAWNSGAIFYDEIDGKTVACLFNSGGASGVANSKDTMYVKMRSGGAEVSGNELYFDSSLNLDQFQVGDPITILNNLGGLPKAYVGAVKELADNHMLITGKEGEFEVDQVVVGPYKVCPEVVFSADDPAEVAAYNAVKTSLETYEDQRNQTRAGWKTTLEASGWSDEQTTALGLEDDD